MVIGELFSPCTFQRLSSQVIDVDSNKLIIMKNANLKTYGKPEKNAPLLKMVWLEK